MSDSSQNNPLLRFERVSKTYAGRGGNAPVAAMAEVTFDLPAGRFIAIRGSSGCGKSTVLLAAGGLLRPDSGTITLLGRDPYALSAEQRASFRAEAVGFVFQQFHLIPYLDVLDNVVAASLGAAKHHGVRDRAKDLIHRFGLTNRMHHTPAELSTGERQRTALARALLNEPKLLLADEPTGNLDGENATVVLDHLAAFTESGGGVLLVTHDPRAANYAHESMRMDHGRLTH